MRFAFIAEKRVAHPVAVLCRVLCVSRSGFYDYLDEPETERDRRDAVLAAKTRAVFTEHEGRYSMLSVFPLAVNEGLLGRT